MHSRSAWCEFVCHSSEDEICQLYCTFNVRRVFSHVWQVQDLCFFNDGRQFLSCNDIVGRDSPDRTIMVWDLSAAAVLSNQIFHVSKHCIFAANLNQFYECYDQHCCTRTYADNSTWAPVFSYSTNCLSVWSYLIVCISTTEQCYSSNCWMCSNGVACRHQITWY